MFDFLKAIILAGTALGCAVHGVARDYVITDYGVQQGDSTLLQTSAIQAVIDRAEADGGGRVVVPRGTYLTGALFFKPGTKLHLEKDATLKGSDEIENFPLIPSRMEGRSIYYHAAVINAYHVDGFSITGSGTINGNGLKYWKEFWDLRSERAKEGRSCTNLEVRRPRLVFVWGCDSVHFDGVNLVNSAFWTNHFYQCNNLLIENCRIQAPNKPIKAPSSDAIDLDVCSNVVIRGCYLDCNDDGVCIKGGKGVYAHKSIENGIVENVLVEDCTFGPALHGILTMGSECIHAKNITLRNCKSLTDCTILRFKMRPDTYQLYEDITVKNVTGTCGTVVELKPWTQFFTLEGSNEKPFGTVRNIVIEDIDVDCKSLCFIGAKTDMADNKANDKALGFGEGKSETKVSDFTLRNVKVKAKNPDFTCVYPSVKFENVSVNGHIVSNPAK